MKLWYSLLLSLFISNAIALGVESQIIPDGTTDTTVNSTDNTITIDSGDRAGDNLFHSFEQFDLLNGNQAFFNNAGDIANIFSRVTGGDLSNIDGLIRANGGANLFLINPAGIIFGEGAALDLGGSFTAATAESIVFSDDFEFNATDSENPPLLTVNMPIGLNFGNGAGSITINNSNLQVNNAEALAFFGGDVTITAGQIIAPGGNIELGGLSQAGRVNLIQLEETNFNSISFPEGIDRGDLTLTNGASANVQAAGGGNIRVNARNIELSGGELGESNLSAGIASKSNSTEAKAGNITLNATDNITVSQGSVIRNWVEESAVGNSGGIDITTDNLFVTGGGQVNANTLGQGNAGAITINASDIISVDGETLDGSSSFIESTVRQTGVGDSGGIDIKTSNLSLTGGGRVSASTFGEGNSGTVTINASDTITIEEKGSEEFPSGIYSRAVGVGDSRGIDITTDNLFVTGGGQVNANTLSQGNAGAITINASDTIAVDGETSDGSSSFIESTVRQEGVGDSGGIDITTSNLFVTGGGQVNANTLSQGNAGAITINASDTISVDGETLDGSSSFIESTVRQTGVGNSGGIDITTSNLSLTGGGRVSASTLGEGNAGTVTINATDTISAVGEGSQFHSGIYSRVLGVGDSGGIDITTSNLSLSQGGVVSASTFEEGNAGAIAIDVTDTISAVGEGSQFPSGIYSRVLGVGDSGGIDIKTSNLSLSQGGVVSASTFEEGNAGTVTINATDTIAVDGETPDGSSSFIESTVRQKGVGDSGGIDITTSNLFLTQGGRVSASTFGEGNSGTVTINASDTITIEEKGSEEFPSGIYSRVEGVGDSGGIDITTSNLSLTKGGQVNANTLSQGNAGAITINASDTISVDGETLDGSSSFIESTVRQTGVGNSGGIDITTSNLSLTGGGRVSASTLGEGNAGTVTINATDTISAVGEGSQFPSGIYSRVLGVGDSGGIDIKTSNLSLSQGGVVSASTFGQGNAGAITIDVTDTIAVHGETPDGSSSSIESTVTPKGVGNSGGIDIKTSNLSLTGGGQVSASTFGEGNSGTVTIDATDTVSAVRESSSEFPSGIYSRVEGVGDSGGIKIITSNLFLTEGGRVSASTFGEGNSGTVTINATDTVSAVGKGSSEFPSGIYSRAVGVDGNSGGIDITTSNFSLAEEGQVNASTLSQGNAGNLTVTASESIELVGSDEESPSGLYANAIESSGDGGNLSIATDKLIVRDRAVVNVGNFQQVVGNRETLLPGTGAAGNLEINAGSVEVIDRGKITADNANGIGGNLTLNADSLTLKNEASISASTIAEQGQGGIVTLNIDDSLRLSDRSSISAKADSGANGGNITIDADFVIANPNQNNDLIASAAQGTGGDIDITTNAIFGLEERSSTPPNDTNDIDASSEFGVDGIIEINELEANPTEGLEELPTQIIDVASLVEQNLCQQGRGSEFVVTGKGGNAPSPTQARDGEANDVDLVEPVRFFRAEGTKAAVTIKTPEAASEIVEAKEWIINDRGIVELVARQTELNASSPQPKDVLCHKQ